MNINRCFICVLLLAGVLLQMGCGTLLYPERRGQTSGRIDPTVVILNGIGVLLFIVPGLVAFAIDFATGAIYLPPEESQGTANRRVIHIDPEELTPETLAAAIYEQTGLEVTVTEDDLRRLRAESR